MTSTVTPTTSAAESTTRTKQERPSLTYKEAFRQYLYGPSQQESEQMVLNQTQLVSNPAHFDNHFRTSISDVPITVAKKYVHTNQPLHLHEFAIEQASPALTQNASDNGNVLVMMHGYGAGLGFFYKNFDGLSAGLRDWNIYALDWLGYGLSSRPKFTIQTANMSETRQAGSATTDINSETIIKAVEETENWFVESLEAWRQAKNIKTFTLMGHSMGGYLAAAYAFKYPENVNKLIMVSPAGVETGYTPDLDESSFLSLFRKDSQVEEIKEKGPELQEELGPNLNAYDESKYQEPARRNVGKLFTYLWNKHISPFALVRNSSFFGPKLVSNWSYWRFGRFPEAEREAMHMYSYRTFGARPSGEYAITRILAPGALARMPLLTRVQDKLKCPSVWIYGDNDWMHAPSGFEAANIMNRIGRRDLFAEFHVVPKAGHHVYLDNVGKFNNVVLNFIKRKVWFIR